MNHYQPPRSRREFLRQSGCGFGAIALSGLLGQSRLFADGTGLAGNAVLPVRRPTAKSIIFLFMEGGPSHIDLFDPKPLLNQLAGKPMPESFGDVITPMGESRSPLLASRRKWKQHGKAGTWASDWVPNIATCVGILVVDSGSWVQ